MTAQRKRRAAKRKAVKFNIDKKHFLIALASLFLIILTFFLAFSLLNKSFSNQNSFIVAVPEPDGFGKIIVYNFTDNKITDLILDEDIEMNLAMQRGNWRMKSLQKIIDSENLNQRMFSDSIMKTFGIPIDAWSYNLPLNKRIKLVIFSLFGVSRTDIDVKDTRIVFETKLQDGEEGFKPTNNLTPKIRQIFTDSNFDESTKIEIVRQVSTNYEVADIVSKILTNMGAHVFSIKKEAPSELDCKILAKNVKKFERIANIFECNLEVLKEGNIDARIVLGDKFARRF